MLQSNSAFLLSVFTEAEQDGETLVLNLGTLNDLAAFDRSFLLAFEDAPYRDDLFFRVEEDGVILARLELLPVGPILRFSKTLDPTEELGFNPRAGIEDQIAALAEFAPSHVTNPRQTPGRAKSTYGGYRITIGHNARRGRDRALNIDKVLKARRAGRRGLAKRIRAARAWHQSGEGKKWHQAQARYQKQHSSVIKDMQSFLAEMTTRRFHKGWGECVIEKNFDKVESQPVHLRAFMSGKDLALGEMSLFFFDQDDAVQVVKAHEVLSRAALDEMAAVFQFKNQAAREKAAGEVQAGGGTIARQGMKALVLTSKTTPTEIAAFVKIIGKYGGSRIRESQRNAVLDEVVLHRLAQRTAEQFEYTSIEEMPCGAVYVERESGEVVVSVCEHLLTDEQVNVLKESFCTNGQTLRVFEDHYDPMRMLRECVLSTAVEGEETVQVGPRSWIVDDERLVFYSPRTKTVRVLYLGEVEKRYITLWTVSWGQDEEESFTDEKEAREFAKRLRDGEDERPRIHKTKMLDPKLWSVESLKEMSPGGLQDMLHDMGYPNVSDSEVERLRLAALQSKDKLRRRIEQDTAGRVIPLMLDALYAALMESKKADKQISKKHKVQSVGTNRRNKKSVESKKAVAEKLSEQTDDTLDEIGGAEKSTDTSDQIQAEKISTIVEEEPKVEIVEAEQEPVVPVPIEESITEKVEPPKTEPKEPPAPSEVATVEKQQQDIHIHLDTPQPPAPVPVPVASSEIIEAVKAIAEKPVNVKLEQPMQIHVNVSSGKTAPRVYVSKKNPDGTISMESREAEDTEETKELTDGE